MVWSPDEEAQRLEERFKSVPSRRQFAADHHVPGGAAMVYQHITGRRPISLEAAKAYAKGFGVPLDQISPRLAEEARGAAEYFEVPMFSRDARPAASSMQPILAWEHEEELPPGEYVMVPRLDVHLSAGGGSGSSQVEIQFDEALPQAFRAEWIRDRRLKPKKLAAMSARGNSMEPTIHDGDSLLVDTSQVDVTDGKVYALWYEGGERVKRLYRMPGGGLRIRSDNTNEHPEIVLGPDYAGHVRIIGRVVHRSGTGGL